MKLIKIKQEHFILVGEFYKCPDFGEYVYSYELKCITDYQGSMSCKKILSSTELITNIDVTNKYGLVGTSPFYGINGQLNLSNIKTLLNEPDIDKKELVEFPDRTSPGWVDSFSAIERKGVIKGYEQCIEDNKDKQYTKEDLITAIELDRELVYIDYSDIRAFRYNTSPIGIVNKITSKREWDVEYDQNGNLKLI